MFAAWYFKLFELLKQSSELQEGNDEKNTVYVAN